MRLMVFSLPLKIHLVGKGLTAVIILYVPIPIIDTVAEGYPEIFDRGIFLLLICSEKYKYGFIYMKNSLKEHKEEVFNICMSAEKSTLH